jgi:hypothetical protein
MTRLLVGNDFDGDLRDDRGWASWWVQRLVWFARDGDVLVLPEAPDDAFLDYVTSLTGIERASLTVVAPAPGQEGLLTARRLAGPELRGAVRAAIAGRAVETVFALWPDRGVAALARALGADAVMPGYGFVDQGGGALLNSKSAFRAIAGGVGVPVPAGAVCANREAAEDAMVELLEEGQPLIVKHDFMSGGRGNEVLSPFAGIRPIGARRAVVAVDRAAVRDYLEERWDWLTGGGRHRVVVERYVRDSSAFFAEFAIDDDEVTLAGQGELLSAPFAIGQVMPAWELDPRTLERLVDGGRRLCEPLRAMGYRGVLSADAIVTPAGEVLFTEYNGRVTGSTHIYGRIGRHVVGAGYGQDRVILERVWPSACSVASFADAVEKLARAGLGYDRADRTGVILTNAFDAKYKGVMYCVVAETLDAAWRRDAQLVSLFADPVAG